MYKISSSKLKSHTFRLKNDHKLSNGHPASLCIVFLKTLRIMMWLMIECKVDLCECQNTEGISRNQSYVDYIAASPIIT